MAKAGGGGGLVRDCFVADERAVGVHLLSPAMLWTKIWIVGSGSADEAREEDEETEEMLLERMMAAGNDGVVWVSASWMMTDARVVCWCWTED